MAHQAWFPYHKTTRSTSTLPPGWIPVHHRVTHQHQIFQYPFKHLGVRERHCKVSCPRTPHSEPSQGLNPECNRFNCILRSLSLKIVLKICKTMSIIIMYKSKTHFDRTWNLETLSKWCTSHGTENGHKAYLVCEKGSKLLLKSSHGLNRVFKCLHFGQKFLVLEGI